MKLQSHKMLVDNKKGYDDIYINEFGVFEYKTLERFYYNSSEGFQKDIDKLKKHFNLEVVKANYFDLYFINPDTNKKMYIKYENDSYILVGKYND